MGGAPSPPPPPDPNKTAAAQTSTNIGTAIANQRGSLINQVTPHGTLFHDQTDMFEYQDPLKPDADPYQIPIYTSTVQYTPEGQAIVDQNLQTDLNLATFGAQQSGRLNNLLSEPVDLSNDATENRLIELNRKRMDPIWADRQSDLETRLSNQGIKRGSDAYDRAFEGFERDRNDQYNQMLLAGRGQALNEALTERNQPLNELIGITSGTQVTQPQFQATPSFNAPTVDYAGIVSDNYNQRLAQWQASQSSGGFPIGGLFSAVGGLASAFSDIRLKTDVEFLGLAGDLPIYAYRYVWGGPRRIGVMAQDMLSLRPDAVIVTGKQPSDRESAA